MYIMKCKLSLSLSLQWAIVTDNDPFSIDGWCMPANPSIMRCANQKKPQVMNQAKMGVAQWNIEKKLSNQSPKQIQMKKKRNYHCPRRVEKKCKHHSSKPVNQGKLIYHSTRRVEKKLQRHSPERIRSATTANAVPLTKSRSQTVLLQQLRATKLSLSSTKHLYDNLSRA